MCCWMGFLAGAQTVDLGVRTDFSSPFKNTINSWTNLGYVGVGYDMEKTGAYLNLAYGTRFFHSPADFEIHSVESFMLSGQYTWRIYHDEKSRWDLGFGVYYGDGGAEIDRAAAEVVAVSKFGFYVPIAWRRKLYEQWHLKMSGRVGAFPFVSLGVGILYDFSFK